MPRNRRSSRVVAGRNTRDPYQAAARMFGDLDRRATANPRDPKVIAARTALEVADARREHAEQIRQASKDVAGATDWSKAAQESVLNRQARETRAEFDRTATQPRPSDTKPAAAQRDTRQNDQAAKKLRGLEQRGTLRDIGQTPHTVSTQNANRRTGDPDAVRNYQRDVSHQAGVDLRRFGMDQYDIRDAQRRAADARIAASQARIRNAANNNTPQQNNSPARTNADTTRKRQTL